MSQTGMASFFMHVLRIEAWEQRRETGRDRIRRAMTGEGVFGFLFSAPDRIARFTSPDAN
jgi:hypothetical protein